MDSERYIIESDYNVLSDLHPINMRMSESDIEKKSGTAQLHELKIRPL